MGYSNIHDMPAYEDMRLLLGLFLEIEKTQSVSYSVFWHICIFNTSIFKVVSLVPEHLQFILVTGTESLVGLYLLFHLDTTHLIGLSV